MGQLLPDPGKSLFASGTTWRVTSAGEALLPILAALARDAPEDVPGLDILQRKPGRFWGRLRLHEGDFFVKGRKIDRLRRKLRTFLRVSPMRVEWRKAWWLASQGIETPEPVAVGEARRFGLLVENVLVTRWVDGARPLRARLEESVARLPERQIRRFRARIAEEVGRLLGALHAAGAYHWEFHDMNLLVTGSDESPRLLAIDLDHLVIPKVFCERDRAWSFHQLPWYLRKPIARWQLGRRELVRFFQGYHAVEPAGAADWRELFRRLGKHFPAEPPRERPRYRRFLRGKLLD